MQQDILKDFWLSALFFPMPLESSLRPLLAAAADMDEHAARKLLGSSFLAKRLQSNPSYYAADRGGSEAQTRAGEKVIAEATAAAAAAGATK